MGLCLAANGRYFEKENVKCTASKKIGPDEQNMVRTMTDKKRVKIFSKSKISTKNFPFFCSILRLNSSKKLIGKFNRWLHHRP